MEDSRAFAQSERWKEIKGYAIALSMLAIALFALYTGTLYLAVIPLLWLGYRAGKERGREEAQEEMERTTRVAQLIQFPGGKTISSPRPVPPRATRYPKH